MSKRTIEVTAEDIKDAKPLSIWDCAVAKACNRLKLAEHHVQVDGTNVYFYKDDDRQALHVAVATLPYEAQAWIQEFDSGKNVQPFSFELEVPDS